MKTEAINFSRLDVFTVSPKEDTTYTIECDAWGSIRKELTVTLDRVGVACKLVCSYKALQGTNVDFSTTVIHKAANTSSDTVVRGVIFDGGVSNYQGKVVIEKIAQGASSKLSDRVLVLGEGTHNTSEPIMQIEANDVTASHASSTGRLDEAELFYLQSRGLSRQEAQDLMVDAFLADVGVK